MRTSRRVLAALSVALLAGAVSTTGASAAPRETAPPHVLKARGAAHVNGQAGRKGGGANGISYHGGPVMTTTKNAYVIWYGSWTGNTGTSIIGDFLSSVGGSPYFNINTTYTNGSGQIVTNAVALAGSTTDAYSQGKSNLSDGAIQSVVSAAITSGRLPKDTAGVYFVLTSSDVSKSGFLTQYCGWHTHASIGGSDIKYSFVGDPTGPNMGSCTAQSTSPNGNPGADGMVSVIAHELEETATDPDLNAWYDGQGAENADKCAWTFGTTYPANGALANMRLGSRDYLIQRNWVNASGGFCALSR